MDPTPEPTPSGHARVGRKALVAVVVILALLVAALGAVVLTRDPKSSAARSTEVFLEAKDDAGPEVFTTAVVTRTPRALPSTTTTTRANGPANAVTSVSGSTVGLYGGTLRAATCNKVQLATFLERNPDKAAAWAAVQGIRSDQIRAYVVGLTPVVLLRDTRVTNHGFAQGRATPRQSILQAGTAVLVDRFGVPRAKCACGNPLTPPHPVTDPVETGHPWPGFTPSAVVVVVTHVQVTTFVLADVTTGNHFNRPVGTAGGKDTTTKPPAKPPAKKAPPVASPAGSYTVQFSGEHLSGPCTPWGTGTGSMEVTIDAATIAITLHNIGGRVTPYRGTYDASTGAFSAPDVQYGLNPLSGTFVRANGVFTVSDGRETSQNVNGGPCIGAFTATQQIG